MLDNDYPIDRLTAVLGAACANTMASDDAFLSVIEIPAAPLTDTDAELAKTYLRAEDHRQFPDSLIIFLRDHQRNPILFEEEGVARASAKRQVPRLSKQLLFAIFRDTGIEFNHNAPKAVS